MTDRIDHRAKAERMLADSHEWGWQAGETTPEVGERVCLAYAAVHALLAIHDALTAADRYDANEARQREEAAGTDPLDEDDWSDRNDRDGDLWSRNPGGCWHDPTIQSCHTAGCGQTLAFLNERWGPLTFAPEATQETLQCPECGHDIDDHNGDPDAPGEWCAGCDDCRLTPSTIARALIGQAVAKAGRRG